MDPAVIAQTGVVGIVLLYILKVGVQVLRESSRQQAESSEKLVRAMAELTETVKLFKTETRLTLAELRRSRGVEATHD